LVYLAEDDHAGIFGARVGGDGRVEDVYAWVGSFVGYVEIGGWACFTHAAFSVGSGGDIVVGFGD